MPSARSTRSGAGCSTASASLMTKRSSPSSSPTPSGSTKARPACRWNWACASWSARISTASFSVIASWHGRPTTRSRYRWSRSWPSASPACAASASTRAFTARRTGSAWPRSYPSRCCPRKAGACHRSPARDRPEFRHLRRRHSAVESAINALEAHGFDRCPDHGIDGFKRYVALAVVGRNLHRFGAILLARRPNGYEAAQRQRAA